MKRLLYLLLLGPLVWIDTACTDQCTETRVFRQYTPITLTPNQVRLGVGVAKARGLVNPGKIYTKDGYLFINELKQGIHVIDNRNPANPQPLAFINIPGNGDIAIRDNFLYADSYMDLVTFDISNLADIHEVARTENVFSQGQFDGGWWYYYPNSTNSLIQDQRVDYVKQSVKTNCEATPSMNTTWPVAFQSASVDSKAMPSNGTSGTGGSMARFTLYDKYLYAVSSSDMKLFNVQQPSKPALSNTVNMGWGIETIFPYKDKLFIGSQSGMLIYDNADPAKPKQLSVFQHARVCDPVVVNNNTAYVTLRSGNGCGGFTNQLDVVDITNLTNPTLLKSYPMRNPHGLGVDFPNLFICEGAYGLKSFNVSDPMQIDKNLQQYMDDLQAYDVIPMGGVSGQKTLLLIGKDGFYQFDYTNPRSLRLLSKIPVSRPDLT
ncbi:LVIVD repeat-containing protein [uncultured Fibrella sp.]|uniref:LVIVD repeat-containing protein n=1 Tax=uncultured Fibrella sp. TaxID=1284596 RepID=UPI0035C9D5AC